MRFKRKPEIIDAVQFTGIGDDPPGVQRENASRGVTRHPSGRGYPRVLTSALRWIDLEPGDMIVAESSVRADRADKSFDGVHADRIKPDDFAAMYAPLTPEEDHVFQRGLTP